MKTTVVSFVLLLHLFECFGYKNEEVEYYVKLIANYTEEIKNFQSPEDATMYKPHIEDVHDFGNYDFIIVGAGAAGSVLANRLSAISQWNVLLIEAGSFENNFTDIPGMYAKNVFTKYNWAYASVPQNSCCLGMVDRRCPYTRGKAIGGTTVINGLVATRGNPVDFDIWTSFGNRNWTYKDVLPHYIEIENSMIYNGDAGYHGVGGLMNSEYYSSPNEQLFAFLEANREIGLQVRDYNGASEIGASASQLNTIHGRRMSTGKAFINPIRSRQNLHILTDTYATKILIDPQNLAAYGVEFTNSSHSFRAFATREVIISAGAIESPHLLLLSGIGPKSQLEQHGIKVLMDLPAVGENLLDHINFLGLNFQTNYVQPARSLEEYIEEYLNGTGPFTIPGSNQGVGFYHLSSSFPDGLPDIELMMLPANNTDPLTAKGFRLTDETASAVYGDMDRTSSFTFFVSLLHGRSAGSIRLNSSNPYDYPLIDSRYLSDDRDLDDLYEGIQFALRLALETEAFQKLNTTLVGKNVPGCEDYQYASKDYFYCALRHVTVDMYHPVGTCKMGPSRKDAVVDDRLRVHGIRNLRVADASIQPATLSAHPAVPTMMVGERASKFIIGRHLFGNLDM